MAEKTKEPVRIKLYGLFWTTRRGYTTQLIIGGVFLVVLFVIGASEPARQVPLPAGEVSSWGLFTLWLLKNLRWIALALSVLYLTEAVIVFRRFARAEVDQERQRKSKK